MGADLYLNSVFDKQQEIYSPQFDEVVSYRDSLPEGDERDKAQETVSALYSKLYEKGYYRDSYNDTSLLNKLGLSWWKDIVPMLDDEAGLPIDKAMALLDSIGERMQTHYPEAFNKFCSNEFPMHMLNRNETILEWDAYFKSKFEKLTSLLRMSIELDEPIYCSL